jgi:saccharopine dehydrogenase-like NADP-dependent oxidoreductase
MKAVVFGGAGIEGSWVVQCLTQTDSIREIVVADIDKTRGEQIKNTHERINFQYVDVTEKSNIFRVLDDADIAVNCVGPFYKFAQPIMQAVINKGVNYVDICDDYDMTQTLLDEYHRQAKEAGITCIVGLGASPGLTNIMAKYGSEQLDKTNDISVFVTRGLTEEAGGAIPYHMMHCWLGEVPVFKNGQFTKGRGLIDGQEIVTFPQPFGQGAVYYFGHPETVTLPRYIFGLQNACCKGTFFPDYFRQLLLQVEALGLVSEEPIPVKGHPVAPIDFLASFIPRLGKQVVTSGVNIPKGGAVMVRVQGEKNGEPKTYLYEGTAHMKQGTATPAAIGAEMLAKGEIETPGVFAPEGCVPAKKFLNRIKGREGFGDVYITVKEKLSGEL